MKPYQANTWQNRNYGTDYNMYRGENSYFKKEDTRYGNIWNLYPILFQMAFKMTRWGN